MRRVFCVPPVFSPQVAVSWNPPPSCNFRGTSVTAIPYLGVSFSGTRPHWWFLEENQPLEARHMQQLASEYQRTLADIGSLKATYEAEIQGLQEAAARKDKEIASSGGGGGAGVGGWGAGGGCILGSQRKGNPRFINSWLMHRVGIHHFCPPTWNPQKVVFQRVV